jgi:hypothetical protein
MKAMKPATACPGFARGVCLRASGHPDEGGEMEAGKGPLGKRAGNAYKRKSIESIASISR